MTIIDLYEIMASSKGDACQKVVKTFLRESCGSKDVTSQYEYNVEKYDVEPYDFSKIKYICFEDYEKKEHPIAIILLAIKWLFISEDISYWNWPGRNMFMDSLKDNQPVK